VRIYATETDLQNWPGIETVPADAASLLLSASGLVRQETRLARYTTDTAGFPSVPMIRDAFRDAVCAQVKFWIDHKINPSLGAAGVAPLAASKSIGGASIQYSTYVSTAQARADAAGTLGPEAWYILADAELLGGEVVIL
jgi:hypothetical protein